MRTAKFESLILTTGGLIILGTILISLPKISWQEALGQILLLPLILVALRFSQRQTLIAIAVATAIYVLLYLPSLLKMGTGPLLPRFIIRGLIYAGVGLGSLEVYNRFKYYLTKIENSRWIDPLTDLYTPQYLRKLIETYIKQHERYQNIFSVILFGFEDKVLALKKKGQEKRVKELGEAIKKNVRNVDEVARIDENRFGLLLPHTNSYGASVCGQRVHLCLSDLLKEYGFKLTGEELIEYQVLGYPEQKKEMEKFLKEQLIGSATGKE